MNSKKLFVSIASVVGFSNAVKNIKNNIGSNNNLQLQNNIIYDEGNFMQDKQYFENKIELILSTLVHEMCHLKIETIGKTGKNGYHNKAWSNLMLSIGLIPTDNGKPGGKLIGYKMTHYIEENGLFSIKTKELLSNGFCLKWKDADCINLAENTIEKTKVKKGGKRIKYSCGCSSVWGKDNLNIFCGKCQKKFEINEE